MADAKKYRITVKRPVEAMNAKFRTTGRYVVTAKVLAAIKKNDADAIASEVEIKE